MMMIDDDDDNSITAIHSLQTLLEIVLKAPPAAPSAVSQREHSQTRTRRRRRGLQFNPPNVSHLTDPQSRPHSHPPPGITAA